MKNLFAVLLLFVLLSASYAYTVHIDAPAVLTNIDRGVLTSITLNVTSGNGDVNISTGGSGVVASDTMQSAQQAAQYAASYLALNESRYNFSFRIDSNDSNVSGPSAGLAMTLLSIAGLEQQQLNPNFTVTGTINANGTVGQIGGVFDKVQAANSIHARYILVPYLSQSNYQYLFYYLSQQAYYVPVIEVKNVSQAVPFAIGNPNVTYLNYNISRDYYPSGLPYANATCTSCNSTAFNELMNYTFNFTQTQINNINSSKFGTIKAQLQSQLDQYQLIGDKGYRYSAADLAFNEYPTAFVFSNYNTANYYSALTTLNNIATYCNLVNSTPQLTNTNYEYVFGGEVRMQWARQTLDIAYQELNASQTSDDILLLLEQAAPAYSWCLASGQMYKIASEQGGSPVMLSQSAQAQSLRAMQIVRGYGNDLLYVNTTEQAYAAGNYGAALYSADYATTFYNASNVYSNSSQVNATVTAALSSPNGIWPQEFAFQAKFYLYQASISNSTVAPSFLANAYSTALLSEQIGNTNAYVQSNFVAYNASQAQNPTITSQLQSLQQDFDLIAGALIIVIILLIGVILLLLALLTKQQPKPSEQSMPSPADASAMQSAPKVAKAKKPKSKGA